MYNVTTNKLTVSSYTTVPVLNCCFSDAYHIYTACLDGIIKSLNYNINIILYIVMKFQQ